MENGLSSAFQFHRSIEGNEFCSIQKDDRKWNYELDLSIVAINEDQLGRVFFISQLRTSKIQTIFSNITFFRINIFQ